MSSIASRLFRAEKALASHRDVSNDMPDPELLKSSLIEFTKYFYKVRTGREFKNRPAQNRVSFVDSIVPSLEKTLRLDPDLHRLAIRCPPRYGKTELILHYIAWGLANYPDSSFIYVSYNHHLSVRNSKIIKRIISLPEYQQLFGIKIRYDSKAAEFFEIEGGGSIAAAGAAGTITGTGAGVDGVDRFGGAIVIDDVQKPDDITSEKYRKSIKDWWFETLSSRVNTNKTPIIAIGQEIHEDDLIKNLIGGMDVDKWHALVLPALDKSNNALMPEKHSSEKLLQMQEKMPYTFASQYMQSAVPAGGGLFKEDWFYPLMDNYPDNIEMTFITADTAETEKTYNDPTVFSFWGLHKIKSGDIETDVYGLHWIDCVEIWIEPKDLQSEFMSFYNSCMRFPVKPSLTAIEKKSTGVTLISVLKEVPGLRILEINRTAASGSKSTRFIEMQKHIASKRISLTKYGKHTSMCVEHMRKITANDSHRYDDIADTAYDAIKIALIDGAMMGVNVKKVEHKVPSGYKARPSRSIQTWKK